MMLSISKELFKAIRRIQIRTDRYVNDVFAGAYASAFKGRGMAFEDVREYQEGDDFRSIDWNVTARMNTPYIKNYREERELTVILLVDVSGSTFFGTNRRSKKALMAEIASTLALCATRNHDKVGLILFSDQVEHYLPPKKGSSHVLRLVRDVLAFSTKRKTTKIANALCFLNKIHKKRGLCFLLSDFMDNAYEKQLALTCRRHDLTAICTMDPREKEIPNLGLVLFKDSETDKEYLVDTSHGPSRKRLEEKKNAHIREVCLKMHRLGAGFLDFNTDESYVLSLRRYFLSRDKK